MVSDSTLAVHASLKRFNTWHVGGTVKQLFRPSSLDDAACLIRQLPSDERIIWLGLGSNVLCPDTYLDATVIVTQPGLGAWQVDAQAGYVVAEAGVTCAKLAKVCVQHGWIEGGFFAGIPGTLGGALAMNAGAYGQETWSFVKRVQMLTRQGQLVWFNPRDFEVGYRHVQCPIDGWFVAAKWVFSQADEPAKARAHMKQWLRQRSLSQPVGTYNCGSVFTNPPGHYAARLIEDCGLKGYSLGGAMVSPKHANFIINTGKASADDLVDLIAFIQRVVAKETGICLIPEVRLLDARHRQRLAWG